MLRAGARDDLCDALASVPPDAPTLCAGWNAHDLATHVWQLSHDPVALIVDSVPQFAAASMQRTRRLQSRTSYAQAVAALREGDGAIACMPGDALEHCRHSIGEYSVHAADVRRANGLSTPEPSAELAEQLWRRAIRAGRWLRRASRAPIVLERVEGAGDEVVVARARIARGRADARGRSAGATAVRGAPLELLLWVHGRETAADVRIDAGPEGRRS